MKLSKKWLAAETVEPPRGVPVYVWFLTEPRRAAWDGSQWRDADTGETLDPVTHWQPIAQ